MFLAASSKPQRSTSEQCLATSAVVNSGPSQIFPFLFLGSQEDVLSAKLMQVGASRTGREIEPFLPCFQEHQITHVINVSCQGERAPFIDENDDEHFLRIPVNDCLNAQLSPYFDQAFDFIGQFSLSARRERKLFFVFQKKLDKTTAEFLSIV